MIFPLLWHMLNLTIYNFSNLYCPWKSRTFYSPVHKNKHNYICVRDPYVALDINQFPHYAYHDDVIKWKHFPRYWPFVREIHRSPIKFPHKGQWRGTLMFTLICARINGWVNNHEAGDLRRNRAHYDVTVMVTWASWCLTSPPTRLSVKVFTHTSFKEMMKPRITGLLNGFMRQKTGSPLVQAMVCRLTDALLSYESMLVRF